MMPGRNNPAQIDCTAPRQGVKRDSQGLSVLVTRASSPAAVVASGKFRPFSGACEGEDALATRGRDARATLQAENGKALARFSGLRLKGYELWLSFR